MATRALSGSTFLRVIQKISETGSSGDLVGRLERLERLSTRNAGGGFDPPCRHYSHRAFDLLLLLSDEWMSKTKGRFGYRMQVGNRYLRRKIRNSQVEHHLLTCNKTFFAATSATKCALHLLAVLKSQMIETAQELVPLGWLSTGSNRNTCVKADTVEIEILKTGRRDRSPGI
ncbi:hypothetical protein BGZ60DRAFT_280581 [Tricladium varicosporioides]|nr:hypothetical protein BGZ60DRAFT_280581 [Hymenoscyphus varicosporioides]